MYGNPNPVLECQQCGDVVRRLSIVEQQRVADNPYNFIVYCTQCRRNPKALISPEFR